MRANLFRLNSWTQVVNSSRCSAGKHRDGISANCTFHYQRPGNRLMSWSSYSFKSVFHSSLSGMSTPCSATNAQWASARLAGCQPSITARSIIASFAEKLFANPANGPVQRLYLIENLLSDSIRFRQQHINVISGSFKGDWPRGFLRESNPNKKYRPTNHTRLQERWLLRVPRSSSCINNERQAVI